MRSTIAVFRKLLLVDVDRVVLEVWGVDGEEEWNGSLWSPRAAAKQGHDLLLWAKQGHDLLLWAKQDHDLLLWAKQGHDLLLWAKQDHDLLLWACTCPSWRRILLCCSPECFLHFIPVKGCLGVVPDPMRGSGTGMSMCTECKALWDTFVICENGQYKINWIELIWIKQGHDLLLWAKQGNDLLLWAKQGHDLLLWAKQGHDLLM